MYMQLLRNVLNTPFMRVFFVVAVVVVFKYPAYKSLIYFKPRIRYFVLDFFEK